MPVSLRNLFILLILGVLLSACAAVPTAAPTTPPTTPPTLPPSATATITPLPEPTATGTPAAYTYADLLIPHPLDGREACDTCHGPTGAKPYPADHAGRVNESCQFCHLPADKADAPPDVTTFTQVECLTCHGPFDALMARNVEAEGEDGNTANPHVYVPHDSTTIVECTLCHTPHTLPPQPAELSAMPQPKLETCYECHHVRNFTNCSQCHAIIPKKK